MSLHLTVVLGSSSLGIHYLGEAKTSLYQFWELFNYSRCFMVRLYWALKRLELSPGYRRILESIHSSVALAFYDALRFTSN